MADNEFRISELPPGSALLVGETAEDRHDRGLRAYLN